MFLYLLNDVGVSKQSPQRTLDLFVFTVSQSESYSHLCSPKVRKGRSWALSSCSSTRLWPFHVDDWFRCSEEGEEGSGFGLCPLITLYYHTGGIYHQTPKASVHGEHWNQSRRLHAIHPGPRKAALLSATTSIFSVRGGCSKEKVRGREQRGKEGFEETLGQVLGKPFVAVVVFFTSSNVTGLCGVGVTAWSASI